MSNPTARRRDGSLPDGAPSSGVSRPSSDAVAAVKAVRASPENASLVVETAVVVNNLDRLISGRVHDLEMLKSLDEMLKARATKADIHRQLLALARSSREAFQTLQSSRDALVALHKKTAGGEVMPVVDSVTGLPNKPAFEARLADIFEKSDALDTVLMMIDIGAMSILTSEVGSKTANKVVRRFATILRKTVKHTDFVARTGPQGFAIIFRNVLPDNVAPIAMRVHEAMREQLAPGRDPVMQLLSVTIGITGNRAGDKSAADLLRRAEDSLLMARKQVGAGIYIA